MHRILSPLIHIFVILFVVAAGDVVHPVLMLKVPLDGLFYAFRIAGMVPSQDLAAICSSHGITCVVAQTINSFNPSP